jgi:hypothetical protein
MIDYCTLTHGSTALLLDFFFSTCDDCASLITNRPSVLSFHVTDQFAARPPARHPFRPSPIRPHPFRSSPAGIPLITHHPFYWSASLIPRHRSIRRPAARPSSIPDHSPTALHRPTVTARPYHLLMLRVTSSSCVASSVGPLCAFPLSTGALLQCTFSSVLLLPINFYRSTSTSLLLPLYFSRSTVNDSASLMITNPKLPL